MELTKEDCYLLNTIIDQIGIYRWRVNKNWVESDEANHLAEIAKKLKQIERNLDAINT